MLSLSTNLSRDLSETELKDAFAAFGEVSTCNIIKDKFMGESRGFSFVEMPNKDEAEKAIAALNGKDILDALKRRHAAGEPTVDSHA